MPSSHLILCHPLLLLPPILPSIRVSSNESTLHMRWPKYWSFSFSIILPMNTQDWFPLEWTGWISLQSKGLSRVFSQHHSSKASIFRHSAFFTVQHSQAYMTTGKTIVLTRRTFVGKVVSAFQYTSYFGHNFSSKEQGSFIFMTAATICSDCEAPQK